MVPDDSNFVLSNSPIIIDQLAEWLQHYPFRATANELLQGFRCGFSLHYEGPRENYEAPNLPSANKKPDIVQSKINKELEAGRVAGPFISPLCLTFVYPRLALCQRSNQMSTD